MQNEILNETVSGLCYSFPLLTRLLAKRGTFAGVRFTSEVETLASYRGLFKVTKTVSGVFAVGREYDARASVIAARESGDLPAENAGMPKGTFWVLHPYLIGTSKGNFLVRLYPVKGAKVKATFYANGERITREQAMVYCGSRAKSSELAEHACITPKLANVVRVV